MFQRHAVGRSRGWWIGFCLFTAIVVLANCPQSQAQALIGSPGAGWQAWNLAQDLNNNGAPFWDVPFLAFGASTPASKNVGWCLTSTGDCQGVGSAQFAPGSLPFWGAPYNSVTDTGGALDPKVYFRTDSLTTTTTESFQATLFLNTATNTFEINEFGWFETNSTGTISGTKHVLFQGSGFPAGTATPDPVGKTVTFTPTQYFGFYYSDVSDPETLNGPDHGCFAYTIFPFNDEACTAAGASGQGDHVFAVFLQQVPNRAPIYWIAGQDPSTCGSTDGDCNLTIVRVRKHSTDD